MIYAPHLAACPIPDFRHSARHLPLCLLRCLLLYCASGTLVLALAVFSWCAPLRPLSSNRSSSQTSAAFARAYWHQPYGDQLAHVMLLSPRLSPHPACPPAAVILATRGRLAWRRRTSHRLHSLDDGTLSPSPFRLSAGAGPFYWLAEADVLAFRRLPLLPAADALWSLVVPHPDSRGLAPAPGHSGSTGFPMVDKKTDDREGACAVQARSKAHSCAAQLAIVMPLQPVSWLTCGGVRI